MAVMNFEQIPANSVLRFNYCMKSIEADKILPPKENAAYSNPTQGHKIKNDFPLRNLHLLLVSYYRTIKYNKPPCKCNVMCLKHSDESDCGSALNSYKCSPRPWHRLTRTIWVHVKCSWCHAISVSLINKKFRDLLGVNLKSNSFPFYIHCMHNY